MKNKIRFRKRKGSLLIEFIYIFPIMVILLVGIYSLGQYVAIKQKVEEAAFLAAKNVAEPRFSNPQDAMYYPYKKGLARITTAAIIRDFLRRSFSTPFGTAHMWQAIDPRKLQDHLGSVPFLGDMFFKEGFVQADRSVRKFFRLNLLPAADSVLQVDFRINANWAVLDSVYLPDPQGRRHVPINDHRNLGDLTYRRGHAVGVLHPPYYDNNLWNRNKLSRRFRSKWVQYTYPWFSFSGTTTPDYRHGFDPRELDNKRKYYYGHYNFPVGGWIIVAKVKYKYKVPIAGALADAILRFVEGVTPEERREFVNLAKEMWIEGTAAYPAPLSVFDIIDADSALHKAQLDPDAWRE